MICDLSLEHVDFWIITKSFIQQMPCRLVSGESQSTPGSSEDG